MSTDWPAGVGRRILAETDSTNAEAARLAPVLGGPEWILALRQTGGRGRRGRAWRSPAGSFSATLAMPTSEPPGRAALRSFVASLGLHDALVLLVGDDAALSLKWPNDVLLNGGKLAGILLESFGAGGRLRHLAIGVGVNLRDKPKPSEIEDDATPPASLADDSGVSIGPEAFLDLLAPAYARREAQFVSLGFSPIRRAWLDRAARLGQPVRARIGTETVDGVFETVDESGCLVLSTRQGRRAISAAEVFF